MALACRDPKGQPAFFVRDAEAADGEAVAAHLREIARESPLALVGSGDGEVQGWVQALSRPHPHFFLVVALPREQGTDAPAVWGMALALRGQGPLSHTASLSVSVLAPFRRQGIAQALLRAVASRCLAAGVERLTASVLAENLPSLRLFTAMGFAVEGSLHDEVLFGAPTWRVAGGRVLR
jgi:L-amino acid N-acyltransferase YncA